MHRSAVDRMRRHGPLRAFGVAMALSCVVATYGQDANRDRGGRPDAAGPYPRLPGATSQAPDWIGKDAPVDVARLFAPVPRDRNAAPLYLDALFEFGAELAVCFPAGPERDRRRQAAEERLKRYLELANTMGNDMKSVSPERIDAVIAPYETGFRKLAEAQRRDRCVFEAGLGADAILPHAQASRQVTRIASLRVRRAVDAGDFDLASRDLELVLRLVRDLGPRGPLINHLIMSAITQVVCIDMCRTILADPGLRVEHCDRLLKAFLRHEAAMGDGYTEALRAEYVVGRVEIRNLAGKRGSRPGPATTDDRARVIRDYDAFYRSLLDLDRIPYAARIEKVSTLKITTGQDTLARMMELLQPTLVAFAQAMGRSVASLRATECLIIMRRWQLKHRGLPRALSVAAREAGLKAVPTDPYDGQPMRVTVIDGQSAVYSVGKDGRDDGGRKDSRFDAQPGDLIYRLPPLEPSRRAASPGRRGGN